MDATRIFGEALLLTIMMTYSFLVSKGCGYHNGVFQILFAQFLLFCGFWFSMAVIGDCNFVEVAEPIQVRQDGIMATRLGLLSYTEMDTGRCYFWADTLLTNTTGSLIPLYGEKQLEYYLRYVLGSQWYPSIALATTAVVISLFWFLYMTSYCCSTHLQGIRLFTGFMIAIVLVVVQGLTFLVLGTGWCEHYQCVASRTAGFTYASCVTFFLSGCPFFFMSNYPGESLLAKLHEEHQHRVMTGDEEALEDEPPEEEEGIEKVLTNESEDPEASLKQQDTYVPTAKAVNYPSPAKYVYGNAEPITIEAVVASLFSSPPKPSSDT
jgi:hypothetical protein